MIRTWHANFCLQSVFVFALIKICIFTWQLALFIVDSRILNYFMQLIVCWVHHYCFSSMAINLIGYEYVLAHRVMYRIMKRSNTITPLRSLSLSSTFFWASLTSMRGKFKSYNRLDKGESYIKSLMAVIMKAD